LVLLQFFSVELLVLKKVRNSHQGRTLIRSPFLIENLTLLEFLSTFALFLLLLPQLLLYDYLIIQILLSFAYFPLQLKLVDVKLEVFLLLMN